MTFVHFSEQRRKDGVEVEGEMEEERNYPSQDPGMVVQLYMCNLI
jgi:hypothetical protein